MPPSVDVSVLIVTYNSAGFIDDCLRSLADQHGCTWEVIVADNASQDGTAELVEERWPDVQVIRMGGNTGFARGNNAAARRAVGRHVLLLNGDARLEPGALARLVDFLDGCPQAGVVSPLLLNPDGTDQGTARSFPTPAAGLFGRRSVLTRVWPDNRWSRRYLSGREHATDRAFTIDWVSGACLMSPASTYRRLGGLDEGFFMHWEDADYCRRVADLGLRVYCLPTARAVHAEGGSRRGWPTAQIKHFHHGAYRYYAKHHLARGPRRAGRPLVAAGLSLRAGALVARRALSSRRPPSD